MWIAVKNMSKFEIFVREVGEWSEMNFGDQKGIGAFAPFAGIVEELGELEEASVIEDALDAYADTAIYFADFCYRLKLDLDLSFSAGGQLLNTSSTSTDRIGKLAHCLLKRHQGIRYTPVSLTRMLEDSATDFWRSLVADFEEETFGKDFYNETQIVWLQVKNRDWKANPQNADQVVKAAVAETQREDPI